MGIGKASNFKIYPDQVLGGMVEVIAQNVAVFGDAARNTIRIIPEPLIGDYAYESFFQEISGLVGRRDTTSVASADDLALTQEEMVSVKLNRIIGPVTQTLDAFRKAGINRPAQEFSVIIGQQMGRAMWQEYLNTALNAADAALSFSGWTVDKSGGSPTTMTTAYLVDALSQMGDAADKVVAWVMHSKPYYDLVKEQISAKITNVASVAVQEGAPVTLGRPVIVTDSPDLKNSTVYTTLGLTENGVIVTESEERYITSQEVLRLKNIVHVIQGEYAYNLGVKGFKWNVGSGGANPEAAAIGTDSNWVKVATSDKNVAGVRLLTT